MQNCKLTALHGDETVLENVESVHSRRCIESNCGFIADSPYFLTKETFQEVVFLYDSELYSVVIKCFLRRQNYGICVLALTHGQSDSSLSSDSDYVFVSTIQMETRVLCIKNNYSLFRTVF